MDPEAVLHQGHLRAMDMVVIGAEEEEGDTTIGMTIAGAGRLRDIMTTGEKGGMTTDEAAVGTMMTGAVVVVEDTTMIEIERGGGLEAEAQTGTEIEEEAATRLLKYRTHYVDLVIYMYTYVYMYVHPASHEFTGTGT